ncbi:hypothetical protein [Niveispirillum irakense]|uniref:hypothetical protein n=1 Tax=Niveispirillum irakense TaxID=34011 RepID=UPI0004912C9B|nr:hypothetical protein [Niveispirillum irakense]
MKDWLINLSMVKFVWLAAFVIVAIQVVDVFLHDGRVNFGGEFGIAILVTLKVGWDKKRAESAVSK